MYSRSDLNRHPHGLRVRCTTRLCDWSKCWSLTLGQGYDGVRIGQPIFYQRIQRTRATMSRIPTIVQITLSPLILTPPCAGVVDNRGLEPLLSACKTDVLPLTLIAHWPSGLILPLQPYRLRSLALVLLYQVQPLLSTL